MAMQFVVLERPDQTLDDVVLSVARATGALLLSIEDPEQHALLEAWAVAGGRKVVRRARGATWDRCHEGFPGAPTTLSDTPVPVKAFLPMPIDQLPTRLRRCQVSGLRVADAEPSPAASDGWLIHLNDEVPMSPGKAAAAAGHVVQYALAKATAPVDRDAWAEWPLSLSTAGIPAASYVHVADYGLTEVDPGTVTAALTVQ